MLLVRSQIRYGGGQYSDILSKKADTEIAMMTQKTSNQLRSVVVVNAGCGVAEGVSTDGAAVTLSSTHLVNREGTDAVPN